MQELILLLFYLNGLKLNNLMKLSGLKKKNKKSNRGWNGK